MPLNSKNTIQLSKKQVNKINSYIIGMAAYLPEKIMASAKWQRDSSKVLSSLGIG